MLIPYKDDNPTRSTPAVTIIIIAINIIMFVYYRLIVAGSVEDYGEVLMSLGVIPRLFFSRHLLDGVQAVPTPATLITAMFMHGNLLHLAGNMLYLWIFGNNIEDYLGHVKYLFFYLISGVIGTIAYMVTQPTSTAPMVGASGAIAGVLGAYLLLYPKARVHVLLFLFILITTLQVPAVVVLGFWIIMQIWQGMLDMGGQGGIAWFAHIGGFFGGIGLLKLFGRRRPRIIRYRTG